MWGTPYYSKSANTYADRGLNSSPDAKAKGDRGQQAIRGHRPRWPSRLKESRSALISRAPFGYPDCGFSVIFPQLWGILCPPVSTLVWHKVTSSILRMGTELVPGTMENFRTLSRLSVPENIC